MPARLSVAPDGAVYILDPSPTTPAVHRFSSTGEFLGKWGSVGSNAGQFQRPEGIVVAADGTVYVADTGNHRVQHFSASGDFLRAWGSLGSGNGQFREPRQVVQARDGAVHVMDRFRIQQFSSEGAFVKVAVSWPYENLYSAMLIAPSRDLYLVDHNNHIRTSTIR